MADDFVEQEGGQTSLEGKLQTAVGMLGNPDDFRTTDRLVRRVYVDGKLIQGDSQPKMEASMLTVYRENLLMIHSIADQVSFTLNTASGENSFASGDESFFGENYRPEEIQEKFPDVDLLGGHPLDQYSVLYLRKDGKGVPLVYFARGANYQREDTPEDFRIDFSLYIGAMDGYRNLKEGEKQALTDFFVKLSRIRFASLSKLTGKEGSMFPNPIDDDGAFSPKKEYYQSDPKAWELRNELAEITVMIENAFKERGESASLVSMMDQKAARIYDLISKQGIDLDNYHFPEGLKGYEPYASVVHLAWNLLNSMYDITDLKANWADLVTGQLEQKGQQKNTQEEAGDETLDFGESQVSLRETSDLSEQEKKILIAQSVINVMFHRLDIDKNEADEIKAKLSIE